MALDFLSYGGNMTSPSAHRVAIQYLHAGHFDIETFRKLSDVREHDLPLTEALAYIKANARFLATGGQREVWDIGGGRILKLALASYLTDPSETGRGLYDQNENEIRASKCLGNNPLFPRVIAHADNDVWLVAEKVDVFWTNDPDEGVFVPLLQKLLKVPEPFKDSWDFGEFLKYCHSTPEEQEPSEEDARYEKNREWLDAHPTQWWRNLVSAVEKCHVDHRDFLGTNWGVKDGSLVILDYGYY